MGHGNVPSNRNKATQLMFLSRDIAAVGLTRTFAVACTARGVARGRVRGALGIAALNNDERADEQPTADPVDLQKSSKRRLADRPRGPGAGSEPQIGRALRSVYDQTVGEAIPDEMLELLGRLH